MLKLRVMTATVFASLFLGSLFFLPPIAFSLLVMVVVLAAAWEWADLCHLRSNAARAAYLSVFLLAGGIAWQLQRMNWSMPLEPLLALSVLWWCVAFWWVQAYPHSTKHFQARWVRLAAGLIAILSAWLAFTSLRALPHGEFLILMLVMVVASADIGAYFCGGAFGRLKLAPVVSPGKSWEGVAGGAVLAVLASAVMVYTMGGDNLWLPILIAVPTALVSVIGDLFESMLKRYRGVKDSGKCLPGHGGMMDRVDGLVAATPVFTLLILLSASPVSGV